VDKITNQAVVAKEADQKTSFEEVYSFRLPNLEVEKSYYRNCYDLIFGLDSEKSFNLRKAELIQAFLSRDTEKVVAFLALILANRLIFKNLTAKAIATPFFNYFFCIMILKSKVSSRVPRGGWI
jgi:hypothetical protein